MEAESGRRESNPHRQFGSRRLLGVVRPERLVSSRGHCPLVPAGDRSRHWL